ncbi:MULTISPECIES: glycoside hydrolase family 2 protein [Paenibacillus]|uniref:glycoside hydrolase family 2 protein n=1 Tax=Paenibacillus TaxID=44249 RepID=UPI00096F008F|nr:glycoside hydrolase family 2 [Paenibacillus odorifer]OMD09113.1 glycoside hydrolase [Paenibacillus odorifer]OZQ69933.1 glycoside hydrolase family 2 [Paenibacillus odorifer]
MTTSILASETLEIPRSEHPHPHWQRQEWMNLNGQWSFNFDPNNEGMKALWYSNPEIAYDSMITVPFSWVSPLSGIGCDQQGIGWYRRTVNGQAIDQQTRLFLRFGAVDYSCDVWINGEHVGSHQGGYGSFEFDVTPYWAANSENNIVVRAEDFDHAYQARGKQGYGEIRGIWQPVWLEARPETYMKDAKFVTSIDGQVKVTTRIISHETGSADFTLQFADHSVVHTEKLQLIAGENECKLSIDIPNPHLWSPETPYLYVGELQLSGSFGTDTVSTYFGIREIQTARFDDRDYRWITLNGKPIYLNGTLDQSYHKTGYFTYPTDEDMRDEIYLMKRLGLNMVRIHIKPEEPRKLYWADKLGILVMEDMPCFWGNPDDKARASYESEALEVIERDYNHPSIFSWVMFNETWGLKTDAQEAGLTSDVQQQSSYLKETQEWVREKYRWAKQLDPTRIVEDNSPCNYDHVESDINTWHFYINGYEQLQAHMNEVVDKTFPGSEFNCIGGNVQSDAPLMNSECGNVWGIEGGAGDSDLAWHYRYMMNEFRRHDKLCGFVFTEFRDVTNEFNGYYRLDGSDKDFGYGDFVPGMTIADLHSPDFIVIDAPPCQTVEAGQSVKVPLLGSSFADSYHGHNLKLKWELWYDNLGTRVTAQSGHMSVKWDNFGNTILPSLNITMPGQEAAAILAVSLINEKGEAITRNFITFDVRGGNNTALFKGEGEFIKIPVGAYTEHNFKHQWDAIQGSKINGAGQGHYVYEVTLPDAADKSMIGEIEIMFEASAKRLLARHVEGTKLNDMGLDLMHGADARVEYNPNTYYMTDEERHPSRVNVLVDGQRIGSFYLPDDPADSRGILSWHYQPIANKLDEAGSYGYLCKASVPGQLAAKLDRNRVFRLELQAEDGGLALYGRNAGRYPLDLLIRYR